MKQIEPYQMKKIYAIGRQLGIAERGHEDDLHALVAGMTGKDSIKSLTYREAQEVIAWLVQLQGGQAPPSARRPREHAARPGGITEGQQRKVWALMYELQKRDETPSAVSLGDRLCAVIKKELKIDAIARTPFAWLDFEAGNRLIEILKQYVKHAGRKRRDDGGLAGSSWD